MEASRRLLGDVFRLLGGPFQGGQSTCFMFYYHMYGKDIGELNIYENSVKRQETLIWSRAGSVDRNWHKAVITVNAKFDFKVTYRYAD